MSKSFLSAEGFPPVFAQLAPASAGPVALPGSAQLNQAVAPSGASTVKIVGDGCGQIQEGSGFVVGPGIVVTNAHVVAGIAHPMVQTGTNLLATIGRLLRPLLRPRRPAGRLGSTRRRWPSIPSRCPEGCRPPCSGIPGAGRSAASPAGVMAEFEAEGRDIYGQGLTVRNVYEIQATVRPGNSGGPLVQPDGEVIGVVFSRSTTNGDIGYALTSPGRPVPGEAVRSRPTGWSVPAPASRAEATPPGGRPD